MDVPSVHAINRAAFDAATEADIVDVLRTAENVISLDAEEDGEIVGHIMFSPVQLTGAADVRAMALAPMAVTPGRQRSGIGSALVRAGLKECQRQGSIAYRSLISWSRLASTSVCFFFVKFLILRGGLALTVVGIALGLGAAAAASRLLQGMLFGITPLDLQTFSAVTVGFGLVTTIASYVPARRATRIDPNVALRAD